MECVYLIVGALVALAAVYLLWRRLGGPAAFAEGDGERMD